MVFYGTMLVSVFKHIFKGPTMTFRSLSAWVPGLLALFILVMMAACDDNEEAPPILITKQAEEITSSSVVTGGIIIEEGSHPITGRGVCFSHTERYPDLEDNYVEGHSDADDFQVILDGLESNTLYFIRAYAENEAGVISFGASLSFRTN